MLPVCSNPNFFSLPTPTPKNKPCLEAIVDAKYTVDQVDKILHVAVFVVIVADFPSPFSFVFGSFGFASIFDLLHNAIINSRVVLGLRVLKDQFSFKCFIDENNGYKVLQVLILPLSLSACFLWCLWSLVFQMWQQTK